METVLVAEDEEAVRRLVVESLRRSGYDVLRASDGAEALSVAASHEGPIQVLVTDIVMPKMRGPELASRLRVSRPDVKVLFMSGYSGSEDTADALTTEDSAFLPKPFRMEHLVRTVEGALRPKRDSSPAAKT